MEDVMNTALKLKEKFTYANYCTWPDDERWELIDGEPYDMSPAPVPRHQRALGKLFYQLESFLATKPCKVYPAPFDVRFSNADDDKVDTVVQPDISVICDKNKIDERGCVGAPDLIVEILSASTAGRDEGEKFRLYQKHAVREYWIVNIWDKTVKSYSFDDKLGKYSFPVVKNRLENLYSTVLEGLEVKLEEVFDEC